MGFFEYFQTVILVSLFWSISFTLVMHGMPAEELNSRIVIDLQNSEGTDTDYSETAQEFQEGIQAQNRVGLVDIAALAFYSGNTMLDLAANFFFAIPSMFTILFGAVFELFRINAFIQSDLLRWIQVVFSVIASIVLLRFILGIRSQSLGAV